MYNDNGAPIDPNQLVSGDGLVMKNYLLAAYPNLVNGVKESGLWAFGYNTNGQLGTNNLSAVSTPVQTVAGGISWKQVSTSGTFTMAIKTDGTLWVWGGSYNNYGQLGLGNTINYSSPTQVGALTNWLTVSAGNYSSAAIKTDGTLWTSGWSRSSGQGNGKNSSSPTQVGSSTNWSTVTVGSYNMYAIKTDGTLWAWGFNSYGQLGLGTTSYYSSIPRQVGALNTWFCISGNFSTYGIHT